MKVHGLVSLASALAIGAGCGGDRGDDEFLTDQALVGPAPDYVITGMTEPPASVTTGATIAVTVTVTNQGNAPATAASTTRYFLSADRVVGDDRAFAQSTAVAPLAAGASNTQTTALTIPENTAAGSYFLIACADRGNTVAELDDRNNCATSSAAMAVDGPDLQVSIGDPPALVFVGGQFDVVDTTSNSGHTPAAGSQTQYFLSEDAARGADIKVIGVRQVGPLAAGSASSGAARIRIRPSDPPGTYYLLACADYRGEVAELSESNNCAFAQSRVVVSGAACGDGVLTTPELCDDGDLVDGDGCDSNCTPSRCGNGIAAGDEVCDDGNLVDGDGCDANCTATGCGNGVRTEGEECDDGDLEDGDSCDSNCTLTICGNGIATAGEECDDGDLEDGDGCDSNCTATACGNGVLTEGETCDDGDEIDSDGCDSNCTPTACGNGVLSAGEECDDGNLAGGDGCEADCTVTGCGDGVLAGGEECDDGNEVNGDGCDSNCTVTACGNGILAGEEICDDRGAIDDDGCDSDCQPSRVVQVVTGYMHTCALTRTGAVRCWGIPTDGARRPTGQLGYGNLEPVGDDETPAEAGDVPVGGRVIQLAAGFFHTCALLDTGAVRCWGDSWAGQLGYGNTRSIGDDETPASAGDVDLGGRAVQLTAGAAHTCALLDTGAVRCWGDADPGKLGYGNRNRIGDDESPAAAGDVPVGGPVVQVSAGLAHTCARLATGAVRCWGANGVGQLGYGHTSSIGDDETPASAGDIALGGVAAQISAGWLHTCAVLVGGAVRCWGSAEEGRLGNLFAIGPIGDDEVPASLPPVVVGGTAVEVMGGGYHTCARLDTGALRCWGSVQALGYESASGNIGDNETPASAGDVPVGAPVTQLAGSDLHTCVVTAAGQARCWGLAPIELLGYGGRSGIPADLGDIPVFAPGP